MLQCLRARILSVYRGGEPPQVSIAHDAEVNTFLQCTTRGAETPQRCAAPSGYGTPLQNSTHAILRSSKLRGATAAARNQGSAAAGETTSHEGFPKMFLHCTIQCKHSGMG
ncbi:hypothetical protein TRVL_02164 [Trypanosoma vivax]|nr:hypothetical protein TRVL_02164 [Trypanosoma vivax]